MRRSDYYSENWRTATDKFVSAASKFGNCKWTVSNETEFDIPRISIGNGKNIIVLNSGVHGIEGYFGSAAQLLFLNEFAPNLSKKVLENYTIVLIHVINGWGMENRMREVMDPHGGLVDLNRNFGIDFSKPEFLPQNEKYSKVHKLLLSKPHVTNGEKTKLQKLLEFRKSHLKDGVWNSIMRGQYSEPYGLAYGGNKDMSENKMVMKIYDEVVKNSDSLISIGLHTGLGRFYRKKGYTTSNLQVSHPSNHEKTKKFYEIFGKSIDVIPDENATDNAPTLLGDLVDCLESRYKKIPVYTADFEIGTGEFPVMSPVLKRMDMGDARYDLLNYGKISEKTKRNLTESWFPSSPIWRESALDNTRTFFKSLTNYLEKSK